MSLELDLRILQLMCSRLCHDLAGPVGAVNNGIELITEMGGGGDPEAMELVASSGQELARRLQYFRVAFGLAPGAVATVAAAQKLITEYFSSAKVDFEWTISEAEEQLGVSEDGIKLLLNMTLLAAEALPRGGVVTPSLAPVAGGCAITVTARGDAPKPAADIDDLVHPKVSAGEQTPRSVQGFFTTCLAEELGSEVVVSAPGAGTIALSVTVPNRS